MPRNGATTPPATRRLPLLYVLASLVLIIATLYLAKSVLIPLALAMLLAFLLSPVVSLLQRHGLNLVLAVILVVLLTFSFLGGIGWVVARQFISLTQELPQYQNNIKQKIVDWRGASGGSFLERIQGAIGQIATELEQGDSTDAVEAKPIPVVVRGPSMFWQLPVLLGPLATAGLVITLVIFMLLERGDMRNRLIRLVGYGRLTLTTKALEEAGERISRYLLMHSIVNGSYGVALGIGLSLIGLPYALLWGVLAALLRFIPYAGPAVSALFPAALSLAAFPGWHQALLVIGFIVVLELVSNMIMEPLLYGRTAGVSEVALIVAIAFWTWLWGPIGLLLATPLTVSLGVLGRYVPHLEFFDVLLSDEPVLEPYTVYYQRLVARDQDEATELVEECLQQRSLTEIYDEVLVPALCVAKKDRSRDNLSEDELQFILQATREIVEDVGSRSWSSAGSATATEAPVASTNGAVPLTSVQLVACPASDEADELALLMFKQLLEPTRYEVELLPETMLASEVVALLEQKQVRLLCIGSLGPGGVARVRYLCKRLRAGLPELKIVVGRWGLPEQSAGSQEPLRAAGADYVGTTLPETCAQIAQLESIARTSAQNDQ
jgi:predicted PurR-regulated permease PerM